MEEMVAQPLQTSCPVEYRRSVPFSTNGTTRIRSMLLPVKMVSVTRFLASVELSLPEEEAVTVYIQPKLLRREKHSAMLKSWHLRICRKKVRVRRLLLHKGNKAFLPIAVFDHKIGIIHNARIFNKAPERDATRIKVRLRNLKYIRFSQVAEVPTKHIGLLTSASVLSSGAHMLSSKL